jgi:hypothetical protein
MGFQNVIDRAKNDSEPVQESNPDENIENGISSSLKLLIKRDNPMAEAAENALELL